MVIGKRNSFKEVPFESCFLFGVFSVSLIKCGDDIRLGRSLNCTGRCHSSQCRALAQVLGGSLDQQTILQTWEVGGMVYF